MFNTLSRMIRTGILTEPLPPPPPPWNPCHSERSEEPPYLPSTRPIPVVGTVESQQQALWKILGRALAIRHVDAGSCNACELEIQALNNPYYNLEGIGIKFVASPRHADLLLVTGPVSVNMEEALRRTYDAIPNPKLVVAVGDCATCGGISAPAQYPGQLQHSASGEDSAAGRIIGTTYATRGAIASVIPVNHTIAGCPPSPTAIMAGILAAVVSHGV